MTFTDSWGGGIVCVVLNTRAWPYTLTETYALSSRTRRFLFLNTAVFEHQRALSSAKMMVDLGANADMSHERRVDYNI